jgi:hypothetical protein
VRGNTRREIGEIFSQVEVNRPHSEVEWDSGYTCAQIIGMAPTYFPYGFAIIVTLNVMRGLDKGVLL